MYDIYIPSESRNRRHKHIIPYVHVELCTYIWAQMPQVLSPRSVVAARSSKHTKRFHRFIFIILLFPYSFSLLIFQMTVNNGDEESQQASQKDAMLHRHEEAILLNRFQRVAEARLEQLAARGQHDYRIGDAERQIIHSLSGYGVLKGTLAGILTFGILRKGPVYMARYLYRRKPMSENNTRAGGGGPTATPHKYPGPPSPNQSPPKTSYEYQVSTLPNQINTNSNNYPRSRNFFVRSIWFWFDSMLSLMMGASVCMAYSDSVEDIKDQIVALPLQPGRSLTSDTFCPVMIRELALVRQENSPAYQRLSKTQSQSGTTHSSSSSSASSPLPSSIMYFHAIQDFAANCQRRHFVERSIRQQQRQDDEGGGGLGLSSASSSSSSWKSVEIPTAISPTAPRWTGEDEDDNHESNLHIDYDDDDDESWDGNKNNNN